MHTGALNYGDKDQILSDNMSIQSLFEKKKKLSDAKSSWRQNLPIKKLGSLNIYQMGAIS